MKGQVEQEARSVAEANRLTRQKLAGQEDLDVRNRFLLDALAVEDKDVVSHDAGFYALPSHAAKILAQPALAELDEILNIVRQVNDQMVGIPASQARILLNGDERVLAVSLRLRTWAAQYCRDRLAKRNARDDDDPMARFQRIYYDLVTFPGNRKGRCTCWSSATRTPGSAARALSRSAVVAGPSGNGPFSTTGPARSSKRA